MAAAACGLHDLAASRRYLWRSLQISSAAHMYDHSRVSLYWLAHLLHKESKAGLSATQRSASQLQALELLCLVQHDAATWQLFRDRAQRTQTELAATLPAELAAAAIERGQLRPVDEVITALLQEG